jgi:hypothetical protein
MTLLRPGMTFSILIVRQRALRLLLMVVGGILGAAIGLLVSVVAIFLLFEPGLVSVTPPMLASEVDYDTPMFLLATTIAAGAAVGCVVTLRATRYLGRR